MKRFNRKKVIKAEGKEQYQIKISNISTFAALENLDVDVDISRA
jgi:hypothetical protein